MTDAWDRWFDEQYDLCRTIEQMIREATAAKTPAYRAALYSALIEHFAEKMRVDLELEHQP